MYDTAPGLRYSVVREEQEPAESYRASSGEPTEPDDAPAVRPPEGQAVYAAAASDLARRYRALPPAERAWVTRVVDEAWRRSQERRAAQDARAAAEEEEAQRDEEALFRYMVETDADADAICLALGWSEAEYESRLRAWRRLRSRQYPGR